jgi:ubiquinone/menaquinone biosynthesis C-methylase UbiE
MGRFASTVPYYRRCREPYPPEFFRRVAGAIRLDGSQTLIDLGCGPGLLALGFAPFVRSVAGVDPEPAMIAAAREEAAAAGAALDLIEVRAEDLPAGLGPFDVVTIGRALHWMTPAPTLALLDRLVRPKGFIFICGASSAEGPVNPWLASYEEFRFRLTPEKDRRRYEAEAASLFAGSAFSLRETLSVQLRQTIPVDTLIGRLFSMSNTSPEMLGPRADQVGAELRAVLSPFTAGGETIDEIVEAKAAIWARPEPDASR